MLVALNRVVAAAVGTTYLWVALGSATGGSARYALSRVAANRVGAAFPWGTLIVNVTGCFVIGIFNTLTGPSGLLLVPTDVRIFALVGLCGGTRRFLPSVSNG